VKRLFARKLPRSSAEELTLQCKTTEGVVEKRVGRDDDLVDVSRPTIRDVAQLMRRFSQLAGMCLTEVPSELFRMKNLKTLWLYNNKLESLPSQISHLSKLEELRVRLVESIGS
jgi:hypothetical protein